MQPGGADRLPLVGPGDQNLIGKETLAAGSLRSRLQAHSSMRKCYGSRRFRKLTGLPESIPARRSVRQLPPI